VLIVKLLRVMMGTADWLTHFYFDVFSLCFPVGWLTMAPVLQCHSTTFSSATNPLPSTDHVVSGTVYRRQFTTQH